MGHLPLRRRHAPTTRSGSPRRSRRSRAREASTARPAPPPTRTTCGPTSAGGSPPWSPAGCRWSVILDAARPLRRARRPARRPRARERGHARPRRACRAVGGRDRPRARVPLRRGRRAPALVVHGAPGGPDAAHEQLRRAVGRRPSADAAGCLAGQPRARGSTPCEPTLDSLRRRDGSTGDRWQGRGGARARRGGRGRGRVRGAARQPAGAGDRARGRRPGLGRSTSPASRRRPPRSACAASTIA